MKRKSHRRRAKVLCLRLKVFFHVLLISNIVDLKYQLRILLINSSLYTELAG